MMPPRERVKPNEKVRVVLAFDFLVMVIYLGYGKNEGEVWCLNLLDHQWLKCLKSIPGVWAGW